MDQRITRLLQATESLSQTTREQRNALDTVITQVNRLSGVIDETTSRVSLVEPELVQVSSRVTTLTNELNSYDQRLTEALNTHQRAVHTEFSNTNNQVPAHRQLPNYMISDCSC